jgi:hypothetical protein
LTYYYFFLQNDELLSDIDLISVLDTQPKLDGYPTDCMSSTTKVILLLCSSKHTKYQQAPVGSNQYAELTTPISTPH